MTKTTRLGSIRNLAILSVLAVALLGQSCKKTDLQQEEALTPESLQQLKEFVASSTGLPVAEVQYNATGKYFVAGKDGKISLADAKLRLDNEIVTATDVTSKQRTYMYTVTPTNVANITIYADNTVSAEWIAALDQSIANWNSTNSRVFMKRVTATTTTTTTGGTTTGPKKKRTGTTTTTTTTSIPSYNILVTTMYDNATSTVAQAYLPGYYGTVGHEVTINTAYNYLSASYKTFTLTHELGHAIGFTHTDGTYGDLVPGTPETDPNSVMNSFVLPWNGFTSYDVLAVTTVYPK